MRNSVLTSALIDEGISEGGMYAAQSFAKRVMKRGNEKSRPLSIAVTGNSFTIGSNCGESTTQPSDDCAWPYRLARRWTEVVTRSLGGNATNTKIEWRMLQANAQGSNDVAHRLPSLIDEYRAKNETLDVIILNNGIVDNMIKPWLEAIVRVLLEKFPQIMIISLVDGIPEFVGSWDKYQKNMQPERVRRTIMTQEHYNLTGVDFAKMSRLLRYSEKERYTSLRRQYPESSLLWPQLKQMEYANGTIITEELADPRPHGLQVYWANYTPRVAKTKVAHFPLNHPPWPTHQYVADTVLFALLRLLRTGMGCADNIGAREAAARPPLPETTVAEKAEVNGCFICLEPRDRLDARALESIVDGTKNDGPSVRESPVVVTCGDWRWVTDERRRSGWQSDRAGSLIRFRLKADEEPTISLTYMTSHASFGNFQVTFRPISKVNASVQPLMGCNDVANFENKTILPSKSLEGRRAEFSLWETYIFPGKLDSNDTDTNELMRKTILDKMRESSNIEYVDMYVKNNNYHMDRRRIKIQTITSC